MELFVVIAPSMRGSDAERVFRERAAAEKYRDSHPDDRCTVQCVEVAGDYEYPMKVFAAGIYDFEIDEHHFVGLYSSYDRAEAAAGDRGVVMELGVME